MFANAVSQAFQHNINWTGGTLKCALLSSAFTLNLGTDIHWSDVSGNEVTGTGYTAGGVTLTSPTVTVTPANSWGTSWAASTAYTVGQVVRPSTGNGYLYRCVIAGTSGATAPSFPVVVGETVTDGTATWVCCGESISVFATAAASWPSSTITASYAIVYDATSGTASTEPLICVQTFATAVSSSNGTFQVSPDSTYGWFFLTPA